VVEKSCARYQRTEIQRRGAFEATLQPLEATLQPLGGIQKFRHCLLQNHSDSPIRRLLALSLSAAADVDIGQVHGANGNDDEVELFQLDFLSTPFGCDRRGVIVH
jgi:hypothetical protein